MIKLVLLCCVPVSIYGAYVWHFGPSLEQTEANVTRLYRKEIADQSELLAFQQNVIRQAVYAPHELDATVTELLQGGRYHHEIRDKTHLYHAQLAEEWHKKKQQELEQEQEEAEKAAAAAAAAAKEPTKKVKSKNGKEENGKPKSQTDNDDDDKGKVNQSVKNKQEK
ncbi:hypothetical protein ACA910_007165 [Epithemia clementina (nom. ined.)]